jgi:CheY-like chemotaxis protein
MTDDAKTVLVVDDDPDAREYLSTVLQDNGFIATTAKSGVAVYRKLKEDDRLKGVPVIIVTGISDEFERFISTRRQVPPPEGYISKPVDAEEFARMVKELTD